MLWPSRTIWLNAGSRPSGLYIRSASRERIAEHRRRDRDRHAGRVHVEQELIAFLDRRVAEQLVEHRDPGERAGDQAVDHHDGDLARLVGSEQHQVGAAERLAGPEQAGPAVAVQVGPRPHVGQRRGQVGTRPSMPGADGPDPDRIDQLQRALARLVEVHVRVAEPRRGHEEGRQREGHLGRVEPLGPLARLARPGGRRSAGRPARTGSSASAARSPR